MLKIMGLVGATGILAVLLLFITLREPPLQGVAEVLPATENTNQTIQTLAVDVRRQLADFDERLSEIASQVAALEDRSVVAATDPDVVTITASKQAMAEVQARVDRVRQSTDRVMSTFSLTQYGQPPRADERLLEAGFSQERIDWINRRIEQLSMETLQSRYEAQVTGRPAVSDNTPAMKLISEMGDAEYERYLNALEIPTTVSVGVVLDSSPAAAAGLQRGDEIVVYDSQRVFDLPHLNAAIREGRPGESVVMEIKRKGQTLQLVVPRGPLGISGPLIPVPSE